ncbi:nuclear transport factor 2 family protein [Hyphomonas sp.]|uniref:nuclear transport factor 2 family protein n=1 Tax=Hyphomonas sp. TaxID=87 RepID=UPI003F6E7E3F
MTGSERVHQFLSDLAERGAIHAVNEHCSDGFTWWSAGAGQIENIIPDLDAMLRGQLSAPLEFEFTGLTQEGDRVAVEATSAGALRNGKSYRNQYHFLFVLESGVIKHIREYHDTAHAADVWGRLEPQ